MRSIMPCTTDSNGPSPLASEFMRFGLFIPQGWRLDLVDIATDKHWAVMRELAAYADDGAWDSLWVYDHFHTVPMPTNFAIPRRQDSCSNRVPISKLS